MSRRERTVAAVGVPGRLAAAVQRARVPLGFVLAALYLWLARPRPWPLTIGALVALGGLLVRAWSAGHIAKNRRLATTGPYAHTRNPLYLGSFLIAAGFALAAAWWLLALVMLFFLLVYAPTIQRERATLRELFGPEYAVYERHVPAFAPRLVPWRDGAQEGGGFSLALYRRHGEWRALLGYVAVVAWLVARLVFDL